MRVLLLCHAFNSLTQRLFVDLREAGHTLSVEFDIADSVTREAVALFRPDVVVAPYLRRLIPEDVWRTTPCLIVHPGPPGDRGPAALDHALLDRVPAWGVTVLRATAEPDGGPVLAAREFPMPEAATKGSLYRHQVTAAAAEAVLAALAGLSAGDPGLPSPAGTLRGCVRQAERRIDWQSDDTATVLRKLRAADNDSGVLDQLGERAAFLFDGHAAPLGSAWVPGVGAVAPGALLAQCRGALCRATVDGAVWIGHARLRRPLANGGGDGGNANRDASRNGDAALKLPAAFALEPALRLALPELTAADDGIRDICYRERAGVGHLYFPVYNGALGVTHCRRLATAVGAAGARDTRVLVLHGGADFWCNGIHLGLIEAADSPADESWHSIQAIDDLALAILSIDRQVTIAALAGNAGAGGAFLALAADCVHARRGVVLNPHYKGMGNLFGSEYWTYLLPRRAGPESAAQIAAARLPIGTAEALRLGLIDAAYGESVPAFRQEVNARAEALAADPAWPQMLADKRRARAADEAAKPLAAWRAEELARMQLNFYGFDPSYHIARYNFIHKVPKSRTPSWLAVHRQRGFGRGDAAGVR